MTDKERKVFEDALQEAWERYSCNGRLVDQFEDNYTECAFAKGFKEGARWMLDHPSDGALLNVLNKGMKIGQQWTPIPKDKDGFFNENCDMYEKLPIIVVEMFDSIPYFHYVDKDNWMDSVADLSRQRYKYYLPCGKLEGGDYDKE